jgi:hypothetical protein
MSFLLFYLSQNFLRLILYVIHTLEYLESLLTVRGVLKPEGITYKGP